MRFYRGPRRRRRPLTFQEQVVIPAMVFASCGAVVLGTVWMLQSRAAPDLSNRRLRDSNSAIVTFDWPSLRRFSSGEEPETSRLAQLQGKVIRIRGYMLPVEPRREGIREFVLAPFVPEHLDDSTDMREIVFVRLSSKRTAHLAMFKALWITGQLGIARFSSPYGTG